MKKLLIAFVVIFIGLNLVSCAEKKDNRTRLTRGTVNGVPNNGASTYGWNILNSQSTADLLYHQNPSAVGSAFMGEQKAYYVNSIVMRLSFNGNQINPNNTYVGFRFYESNAPNYSPDAYLLGAQTEGIQSIQGSRNGNSVHVIFDDGGSVIIEGTIQGSNFVGNVFFDGSNHLGSFNIPVTGAIFN